MERRHTDTLANVKIREVEFVFFRRYCERIFSSADGTKQIVMVIFCSKYSPFTRIHATEGARQTEWRNGYLFIYFRSSCLVLYLRAAHGFILSIYLLFSFGILFFSFPLISYDFAGFCFLLFSFFLLSAFFNSFIPANGVKNTIESPQPLKSSSDSWIIMDSIVWPNADVVLFRAKRVHKEHSVL